MIEERENRNAVFGASQGIQVDASDRVKAELGLDIPAEEVPLPSRGKIYPATSPLHGRETLAVRAMTIREEDILTSQALIKKGTVITELIKSCIIDRSVNVNEMIAGDRHAMMVAIRIMGYGPEYKADISCPACDQKNIDHEFRLDQMEIKRLEIEPVAPGVNLFRFPLPVSKHVVEFKFLTGRDEEEIVVTQQKMKKLGTENDRLISGKLKYAIVSFAGKTDKAFINTAIDRLLARDSLELRRYMEKSEPGVKMAQDFSCRFCDWSEEVQVPLGPNFFWPQS